MHLHRRHANPEFAEGGSSERCICNVPPARNSAQQNLEPSERMQFHDYLTVRSSILNLQNYRSKGSCIPSSTPLQSTSTTEERPRIPGSCPPSEGNFRWRGYIRPGMVGNQHGHSQLPNMLVQSDASGAGWGGCVQKDRDKENPHLT